MSNIAVEASSDRTASLLSSRCASRGLEEALILLRARWQIDLLCPLWKNLGRLAESRSDQPWRQGCELDAKMVALLVQHRLLVLSCWQFPDRSLPQAAQTIQRYATSRALALRSFKRLGAVIISIQCCLQTGCRITRRRKHPSTYPLLLGCRSLASWLDAYGSRDPIHPCTFRSGCWSRNSTLLSFLKSVDCGLYQ